jgi:hypothetical protein
MDPCRGRSEMQEVVKVEMREGEVGNSRSYSLINLQLTRRMVTILDGKLDTC